MNSSLSIQDSVQLFNMLSTQHEDWIVARAMEIVEQRVFRRDLSLIDSEATKNYLRVKLAEQRNEVFVALFMDAQNRVIAYEELFKGTVSQAVVYPRGVLAKALEHNAASVIFSHNHPSGVTTPSEVDKVLTAELKTVLAAIDVRVLDHVIIGQGEPFSFAEMGLL
ncbi:DNA repair protein RadC [Pseudomonas nabeulensis]|uniref:DNA repair protein RadC n=3 Tax=Gammaproteobacteria TaxID=1236 RepID=A0A4Z0B1E0_9PSED|nr:MULTISPECIES: DNA repair protein RadC [Pseudomonas]MQT88069.1 DNA repair protein RadC [Pseudomonas helleri]TFY92866.1 DNA repair protein RadC [Pseudomonas nabeulensis]